MFPGNAKRELLLPLLLLLCFTYRMLTRENILYLMVVYSQSPDIQVTKHMEASLNKTR